MRATTAKSVPAARRGGIRGILFDKDGTLLDFDATWTSAYRQCARIVAELAGGIDADSLLTAGGYDPVAGRFEPRSVLASGTNREIATLWARLCTLDRHVVVRVVERELREASDRDAAPITDLEACFADLASRGYLLGVATMDDEAPARSALDRLGARRHLSFLCGGDSGLGTKPAPGMVNSFCAATGLEAGETMVVGDTPHDMEMARAAGAGCRVAVLSGACTRAVLEPLADHVIESIEGLDHVLEPPIG